MAKQRQNPEFNPTRIFQPVAAPVDTYFRPMLRGPEPNSLIQVASALSEISPTLQRLASDSVAAGKAAEMEYGQTEAMREVDDASMLRKATEYIEKEGGVAPWRYQSFLETAGQRLVRDRYQAKLYEQLDDLSSPTNPDGTVRDQSYVLEKMNELYKNAGIPETSFYMNRGAAIARSQVDQAIMGKVMVARAEKVREKNQMDLMDGISFSLDTDEDLDAQFGPNGNVTNLVQRYYEMGGTNHQEILIKTVHNKVDERLAAGDFDRARALADRLLTGDVGNRRLGDRFKPILTAKMEEIDNREREYEIKDIQTRDVRKRSAVGDVYDRLQPELYRLKAEAEKAGNPFVALNTQQMVDMVQRTVGALPNVSEDIKASIQGDAMAWLETRVAAMNSPKPRNEIADAMMYDAYRRDALSLDKVSFENRLTQGLATGSLSLEASERLREIQRRADSMVQGDRELVDARLASLSGVSWTGLPPSALAIDGQVVLADIGNAAALQAHEQILAEINSPKFKQENPDEGAGRSLAIARVAERVVSETRTRLATEQRAAVEQFNLTTSFEPVADRYEKEASEWTPMALEYLGVPPGTIEYAQLEERVSNMLVDDIRTMFEGLGSEAGSAPMTAEQRRRAVKVAVPDIKAKLLRRLKSSPEALGANLPAELRNVLKRPEAVSGLVGQVIPEGPAPTAIEPARLFATPGSADTPQESRVAGTASQIAALLGSGLSTPESRTQFDTAKRTLNADAEQMLAYYRGATVSQYRERMNQNPYLQFIGSRVMSADTPAFKVESDGVYVMNPRNRQYSRSPRSTAKMVAAKAIVGYTPEEITSRRTAEGLNITEEMLNPAGFLMFTSMSQFDQAVSEYNASGGNSGYIAEVLLPALSNYGTTFDSLFQTQFELLKRRKPAE